MWTTNLLSRALQLNIQTQILYLHVKCVVSAASASRVILKTYIYLKLYTKI